MSILVPNQRKELLHYATYQGRSEFEQNMLDIGADPNAEAYDTTAICGAASSGDLDTIRVFRDRGATLGK